MKPVCSMCDWHGRRGSGRAWAVWAWTFVDGTTQLICNRHQQVVETAGGFGVPLSSLSGLLWIPSQKDEAVANAAKPEAREDRERRELRSLARAEVERYMAQFVFEVTPVFKEQRRSA